RMNGVQNFGLFVAHIIGMEGDRRLHRREADELHDVIRHHVAQRARRVVIASTSFDADELSHGDLHMIDVVPVPDRLKKPIPETKYQDILDSLFAKIMIDAEDLALVEHVLDLLVQILRGLEIVTEWLLDDHTPPGTVLFFRKVRLSEFLHRGGKKLRRNGEVKEVVAVSAMNLV